MIKTAYFRFYEELNDFLPEEKKKIISPRRIEHKFIDKASVKDMIESIGVPHIEVDLILANGNSVNFSYIVQDKDEISVYPVFESFDIKDVQHLREKPLREPKFIVDVHLGRLAKYMRLLGFDTLYENNFSKEELIDKSINERRTIITKDRNLLKRNEISHAYWVRNIFPEDQLKELIERFDLKDQVKEFSRCLECNNILQKIDKEKIEKRLPPKVKEWHNEFYYCSNCDKIFWKGSHYEKMKRIIEKIE